MVTFLAFEKACLCSRPTSLHAASGGTFWVSILLLEDMGASAISLGCSQEASLSGLGRSPGLGDNQSHAVWPSVALPFYVCVQRLLRSSYFFYPVVRSQRVVLNKCLVCLGLRRMIARVTHADACRRRRSTHPRIARRLTRRRRSCQSSRNSELLAGVTNAPIWCHFGSQGRHRRHPSMSVGRSADCLCSHGREFEDMWPPCRHCRVSGMIVLGWWC